jgi:hypothetical protein
LQKSSSCFAVIGFCQVKHPEFGLDATLASVLDIHGNGVGVGPGHLIQERQMCAKMTRERAEEFVTEGFETGDLKEAKGLLDELAA